MEPEKKKLLEPTAETVTELASNVLAAQNAIREVEGKCDARIKEGEDKALKFVKDAMAASEALNRQRVIGEIANDYSCEGQNAFERVMTDRGPHARMLKGEQLSSTDRKIARFQELCDLMLAGAQAVGVRLEVPTEDGGTLDAGTMRQNEAKLRNSMEQSKVGKAMWREFDALRTELRAVTTMDTGTEIAPWVPTMFSPQYINRYVLALKVAGQFPMIEMPSATFRVPVMYAREAMTYSMPGEATGALGAVVGVSTLSSTGLYCTLTAKKSHKLTVVSDEGTWDSIVPVLPVVQQDHADWHAYCLEQAIVNGDTTVTHRDTNTPGGTPGATDYRQAWMGLRMLAIDATTCKVDLSGSDTGKFSLVNLRQVRKGMGVHGVVPSDCFYLMGPIGYIRLLNDATLTAQYAFGLGATSVRGELGNADGMPIIVSEVYPDLTADGGLNTASTYASVMCVNKQCFYVGNRLGFQSGYADLSVLYGVQAVASWKRTGFCAKQTLSTANAFAYMGHKLSATA
jgi:hypothetical protein